MPRTSPAAPLADFVRVRGRFHRSVHLSRDWEEKQALGGYLATPAISGLAGQILAETARSGGSRAWTLTGPYGVGKSAFSLFLADALSRRAPRHPEARRLRQRFFAGTSPLRPILIQAERAPLAPRIAAALGKPRTTAASALAASLSEAARRSRGGLLLIVDELGKYLEFAARDPREDVFLLQQLAEAASRSSKPLVFLGILHSGFGDYFADRTGARRAEWQKVQGRFHDIAFSLPGGQLLDLVGAALETDFPPPVEAAFRKRFDRIAARPGLAGLLGKDDRRTRLAACLPLHPVAALTLWPLFRSKAAQNERSLFAFLTGHEPFGFSDFLSRAEPGPARAPLYGLPDLYDHLTAALGQAVSTGRDAHHWTLMERAVERVPAKAPPLARDLAKAIGLLDLYGEAVGLRPDREVLEAAADEAKKSDVRAALAVLEDASIAVFRKHRKAFGLWDGSDVDLEAAFARAAGRTGGASLAERLRRTARLRPLPARAHSIRTGTSRFFEVRVSSADELSARRALAEATAADGCLLFLPDPAAEPAELSRRASAISAAPSAKPLLVAAPRDAAGLRDALDELERWEWTAANTPELESDPVARAELAARTDAARTRFRSAAGPLLGLAGSALDPARSEWFQRGERITKEVQTPRALQDHLSRLLDAAYDSAPPLHNELLNRERLSSAAAAARRTLIGRVLRSAREERLGIEGYPPEASMYEAMLGSGRFHAEAAGGSWRLQAPGPNSGWEPVWRRFGEFLETAEAERVPLTDLASALAAPPFGLRSGPFPVFLAVALAVRGDQAALYEDGVFLPEVREEAFERLVRRPETFEIRSFRLSERERGILAALDDRGASAPAGARTDGGRLLRVVRELIGMVHELPPFAQRTRRIAPASRSVRECLLSATDPRDLLFRDLPRVFHLDLASGRSDREQFVAALRRAVTELTRAYPRLLDEVEGALGEAFGASGRGEALQTRLRRQAERIEAYAGSDRLRRFLREAVRTDRPRDEWCAALARAALDGKPLREWRDQDASASAAELRALAAECDALESLAAAGPGASPGPAVHEGSVRGLASDLRRVLEASPLDGRSQTLALALAAKSVAAAAGASAGEGRGSREKSA